MKFTIGLDSRKFYLVAKVVPFIQADVDGVNNIDIAPVEAEAGEVKADAYYPLVLGWSTHAAKRTKQWVSAVMRFEFFDISKDVRVHSTTVFYDLLLKVVGISPEREVNALSIRPPECDSSVANSLIKGMPQISHNVKGEQPQFTGDSLVESEFNDLLSGLVIDLSEDLVATRIDEVGAARFKLGECHLSAFY